MLPKNNRGMVIKPVARLKQCCLLQQIFLIPHMSAAPDVHIKLYHAFCASCQRRHTINSSRMIMKHVTKFGSLLCYTHKTSSLMIQHGSQHLLWGRVTHICVSKLNIIHFLHLHHVCNIYYQYIITFLFCRFYCYEWMWILPLHYSDVIMGTIA